MTRDKHLKGAFSPHPDLQLPRCGSCSVVPRHAAGSPVCQRAQQPFPSPTFLRPGCSCPGKAGAALRPHTPWPLGISLLCTLVPKAALIPPLLLRQNEHFAFPGSCWDALRDVGHQLCCWQPLCQLFRGAEQELRRRAGEARAPQPSRAVLPGGRALMLPRHCSNLRGYGGVSHRALRKRQKPASGIAWPPSDAGSFSAVHVSVSPGRKFCKVDF